MDEATYNRMKYELEVAGWRHVKLAIWVSPSGLKYCGIEKCYELMKAHPELQQPPFTRIA